MRTARFKYSWRPDWPRSQPWPRQDGLGLSLGLEHLSSVLLTWPRKCAIKCTIILVVSTSWLHHCNIHYKDVVKHSNVRHKFSYVLLALSPRVLSFVRFVSFIMRPSSVGGGRILRRTLSVCLSVRPVIVAMVTSFVNR